MTSNVKPKPSTSKKAATKITPIQRPPWYYQAAIGVLKPLYRLQVWQRSHQNANYRSEVAARFGHHYPRAPNAGAKGVIWCHAVSLGETNTVAPLLDALMAAGYQIWLTNTTQTGFARGASRFAKAIDSGKLSHSFVPVDSPKVIERFLAHVQPIAALFVETELWANILAVLAKRQIPSILVNGRLSASSFTRYQKIAAVSQSMMDNLTLIIAQDAASAERFCKLGAESQKVVTAGSLKWVMPQANTNQNTVQFPILPTKCPIWVAASTHDGEEQIALNFQRELLNLGMDALLILVPRHPERFDEVAKMIESNGFTIARRSQNEAVDAKTQVYLADSMGELMHWYQSADVALVGGSLVDVGGHNPVEPASVATPILMGKFTYSCQEVVDKLAEVGALFQPNNDHYQAITIDNLPKNDDVKTLSKNFNNANFNDAEQKLLFEQLVAWLTQPKLAEMAGKAGEALAKSQQSALTDQLNFINQVLEPTS